MMLEKFFGASLPFFHLGVHSKSRQQSVWLVLRLSATDPSGRSFLQGAVENGKFTPARERLWDVGIPNWILWPAYSGQYADESTPIWWHPEWRDIIIRGGSKYKNPNYNHSRFADGRSSIDKIVDVGFDGAYLDNVSRSTSSVANWEALQVYNKAHPEWYLEP